MDRYGSLRQGLVRAWCPSISGGGYTLPDLSPYRANGTLTNMGGQSNWVAYGRSRAIQFDGTNDFSKSTSVPRALYARGWAFSVWFAATSTSKTRHSLYSNAANTNQAPDIYFHIESAGGGSYALNLYWGVYGGVSSSFTLGTAWAHYVVSVDAAGTISYYRNGRFIGNAASTFGFIGGVTDPQASLGAVEGLAAAAFTAQGYMDDARFYGRPLTAADVAMLATQPGIGLIPTRHRRGSALSQFWTKVSGVWKTATPWINVGGTWKRATPKLKVSSTWKG